MTPLHRPLAALNLPRSVPALITHALAIVKAMTGNPAFPSPSPTLAQLTQATSDLQTAETAALTRTRGTIAIRNEKRAVLVMRLQETRESVQATANANRETAASVIQSAGLGLRRPSVPGKRVFAAKDGRVSGSVHVVTAAVGKRASYEWQSSTDGGKTWVSAPSTLQAKTSVAGLTPGATVLFRYRTVTKTGVGDWSESASIVVR